MKKKDVIDLIRYFTEGNSPAFRDGAYKIATDFLDSGDTQLGEYVLALLSDNNAFIPQDADVHYPEFFKKVECLNGSLPLPSVIADDISGLVNAIGYHAGVSKFLFSGAPGTGKTESVKHLARILSRDLLLVDFDQVIDSRLGQTSKNISNVFESMNKIANPDQVIILFDEIDSLAMDRTNSRDLREMGRATSSVLKGLDSLNPNIVLIATTNLIESFDKALVRRFDKVIEFNRYERNDLVEISVSILDELLTKFKFIGRDKKLFQKIINLQDPIPYPGDLKNMIKTSIAFSNPSDNTDYLRRLFHQIKPEFSEDLKEYKKLGFTLREIEVLSAVPKSTIARNISGGN